MPKLGKLCQKSMVIKKTPCWRLREEIASNLFLVAKIHHRCAGIQLVNILNAACLPPQWFVTGRTVFVPKPEDNGGTDELRPITCLNIAYKMLTKIITTMLYELTSENGALPKQQRALKKKQRGCFNAFCIDHALCAEKAENRDGMAGWID